MNALAQELLVVAKEYLGPAAPAFLSRELKALGVNANTVETAQMGPLADRARVIASRLMDADRAAEFADKIEKQLGKRPASRQGAGHRLASDAAAALLMGGRSKQAEFAYRELVEKHNDVDSHRGLARALLQLGDSDGALAHLRDGAAVYARAGDRASAVALLADAVEIAPSDLASHRRFAAALANQGDLIGACDEYARFVDVALGERDTRRAWLELAYGREALGDLPQLRTIVDRVAAAQSGVPTTPRAAQPAPAPRPSAPLAAPRVVASAPVSPPPMARSVTPEPPVLREPLFKEPVVFKEPPVLREPLFKEPLFKEPPAVREPVVFREPPALKEPLFKEPPALREPTLLRPQPAAAHNGAPEKAAPAKQAPLAAAVEARTRPGASAAVLLKGALTLTHAEHADLGGPVNLLERVGFNGKPTAADNGKVRRTPPRPPVDLEAELARLAPTGGTPAETAAVADVRATLLIAARDPRATDATLDAARKLLALRKLEAASDVLLDFIGAGFQDREAQRLLIEVDCELGRRDVAREKCQLLGAAYRLDGKSAVADDVERLARIL